MNDSIMKLKIALSASRFLTLVALYAPTPVVSSVPSSEMRVGSVSITWSSLGQRGVGMNSNDLLLLRIW